MSLREAIETARKQDHAANGKCSMCQVSHAPFNGKHYYKDMVFPCGNDDTCLLCHNAGMEFKDQCAACGRIEMSEH